MTIVSSMSNPSVTFSQQSELWLDSLKNRKRKPVVRQNSGRLWNQ